MGPRPDPSSGSYSDQRVATRGSAEGFATAVSLRDYECDAAKLGGDSVCQRRTAYWYQQGILDDLRDAEPKPPSPTADLRKFARLATPAERVICQHQASADETFALIGRTSAHEGDSPCDLAVAACAVLQLVSVRDGLGLRLGAVCIGRYFVGCGKLLNWRGLSIIALTGR
jgi:hypothetical protein